MEPGHVSERPVPSKRQCASDSAGYLSCVVRGENGTQQEGRSGLLFPMQRREGCGGVFQFRRGFCGV